MRIYFLTFLILSMNACSPKLSEAEKKEQQETLGAAQGYFEVIPETLIDKEKNKDLILLGQKLYFETRLSANNKISCNSCHGLESFGVDNEKTSPGHDGRRGDRNSPTSYNAALHFAQFWDGRAKDVEEQALGPLLNPIEHGLASEEEALKKIDTPEYQALFKKAFSSEEKPFTFKNIGKAIGAFERTLLTPSRFDDYLKGSVQALNKQEQRGLKRFLEVGCVSCHAGVAMGGDSYQVLGAVNEYETEDLGRFNVTKDPDEKKMFKVPSLRNIAKTGPYFHDGSISDLKEAIRLMAYHQLDEKLEQQDIDDIHAFLSSLTAKKLPKF